MESSGPSEGTGSDASGPDPQLAVTMGFTGFGKKARTFDLEAMFEQTRRTAVERSRKTLEAREKEEEMNREKELRRQNEDIEPTSSGSNVVRDCSKPSSRDTSSSGSEESSDSSDDELIGPPLPPKMVGEPDQLMETDILGPLPPPLSDEEEDDDDDDDEGEDEEENPVRKIPDSHEITLRHGTKTVSVDNPHVHPICPVISVLSSAAKSSPASKPGSTPSRPSSAKRASSSGSASKSDKDLETQVIQLNEQVHSLKLALEGVEKERDFYFGKLREIELLCQEHGQENDDLVQRLMEVLYASEEHEGHTDEPEAEEQTHDQQPQQQEEY